MGYFNSDYSNEAAWYGVMWALQAETGWGLVELANLIMEEGGAWANIAFSMMLWGNELIYGILTIMWWTSYVKEESYQEVYYKGIKIGAPIGWGLLAIINLLFIVDVIIEGSFVTLVAPLAYDALMFIWGAIAYYVLYPDAYHYYRWDVADYADMNIWDF